MYDKSKKKLVLNIIGMASAASVAVSMILMFRGILSQFIAMPIAIVSPAIGIMASFIKEWDWKEMSGLKKSILHFSPSVHTQSFCFWTCNVVYEGKSATDIKDQSGDGCIIG